MVKIVKNPGNGRLNNLNNLNEPVLNVLKVFGLHYKKFWDLRVLIIGDEVRMFPPKRW